MTLDNAILTVSLHAHKTGTGDELNAFLNDGFAMVIRIVLTALMKIQLFITAHHQRHVRLNSFNVKTNDASTKIGFVIMTTTVGMVLMSRKIVHSEHVRPTNFLAAMQNVYERPIYAMAKMIVAMVQTNKPPNARLRHLRVQARNSGARMENVFHTIEFATSKLIAMTALTNLLIVMSTSVQKLKRTNANISASIR